jgi:TonB family protein
MRRLGTCILLFFASLSAICESKPTPALLVADASNLVNIRQDGEKPFQMDLDFTAQVETALSGHLTLKWVSKDQWRREIEMGDYRQLDVRHGEYVYTTRNLTFTPLRVLNLLSLTDVLLPNLQKLDSAQVKERTVGGVKLYCIIQELHRMSPLPPEQQEICVNKATREVVSRVQHQGKKIQQRLDFTDYRSFRGHRFPFAMEAFAMDAKVLTVRIVALNDESFEDALFIPPPRAIVRRECPNIRPPKAIKTPEPEYADADRKSQSNGTVTVALTVRENGTLDSVHVIGKATPAMDDAARQILKTWEIQPAMCGNEPVAADIQVEFSFRLLGR